MYIMFLSRLMLIINMIRYKHQVMFEVTKINNNNNSIPSIVVKTNRSTLHTVYNIQQSATQDSSNNQV